LLPLNAVVRTPCGQPETAMFEAIFRATIEV
jgi:hypothetical protein